MVIDSTGHAQKREVKTGIEAGQQVQIISGLNPGEEVVTQGAYGLPDKAKVKVEAEPKAGEKEDKKDKKDKEDTEAKPSPGKGPAEKGGKEKD
jgi:hypothetical protein